MSGPWEDFRAADKPPWEDFRAAEKGPQEDKYRADARRQIDRTGSGTGSLQRQILQGLTLGTADEITAAAMVPFEMLRLGTFNPVEAYNHAKAREDLALERDRQRDGHLGTAAELAGGITTGVGAARAGLTAARALAPNAGLAARSGAMAADGAAFGAITGAATGSGADRLTGAATGGLLGLGIGGALPVAGAAIGAAAAPITSNIAARVNPEKFAQRQVARAISESGRAPMQVVDDVAAAAAEGQGVFTVADALGNSGQRMLSTVARNPGPGRTATVEFLEGRQAEQGRRLAGAVDDAFGSTRTAQQLRTAEEAARRADATHNYGQAREAAGAVDVSRAIAAADDVLLPGATRIMSPQTDIADNTIEAVTRRARALLTDGRSNLSDFSQVLLAKQNIDDMIARAAPNQQRILIGIKNELDAALEAASQPYAAARNAFRESSRTMEAIDTGRQAAQRGRHEDTIPAFQRMNEAQQQGFRTGYADPIMERMQNLPLGTNKAREFTSDASRAERMAFALPTHASLLNRQIGRENTMFATRNQAMGGSRTADNLADDAAMGVSPEIVSNLLSGNWMGAARNALSRGQAAVGGNTPAVRQQIAELLLARGDAAGRVGGTLQDVANSSEMRRRIIEILARGGMGGGAALPGAFSSPATSGR